MFFEGLPCPILPGLVEKIEAHSFDVFEKPPIDLGEPAISERFKDETVNLISGFKGILRMVSGSIFGRFKFLANGFEPAGIPHPGNPFDHFAFQDLADLKYLSDILDGDSCYKRPLPRDVLDESFLFKLLEGFSDRCLADF